MGEAMALAPHSRLLLGHLFSFGCFRSISISIKWPSSGSALTHRFLSNVRLQRRQQQQPRRQFLLMGSDHYQEKATKYWDHFHKIHHNRDCHYLEKDWGRFFSAEKDQWRRLC